MGGFDDFMKHMLEHDGDGPEISYPSQAELAEVIARCQPKKFKVGDKVRQIEKVRLYKAPVPGKVVTVVSVFDTPIQSDHGELQDFAILLKGASRLQFVPLDSRYFELVEPVKGISAKKPASDKE